MAMQFKKATRKAVKARIAVMGPSGSGKTWTGITMLRGLVGPTGRIAVIDTERGSAQLYSDLTDFDVLELDTFGPELYVKAIEMAAAEGYDGLLIDSLSHAWMGKGGALEALAGD
jgi:KaiC/GvpD/RAD55 family RecA-like ATPase